MNSFARCVFALIMVLVAASPLRDQFAQETLAASSGTHLWWIFNLDFKNRCEHGFIQRFIQRLRKGCNVQIASARGDEWGK